MKLFLNDEEAGNTSIPNGPCCPFYDFVVNSFEKGIAGSMWNNEEAYRQLEIRLILSDTTAKNHL